jgi:hypothetical protein
MKSADGVPSCSVKIIFLLKIRLKKFLNFFLKKKCEHFWVNKYLSMMWVPNSLVKLVTVFPNFFTSRHTNNFVPLVNVVSAGEENTSSNHFAHDAA